MNLLNRADFLKGSELKKELVHLTEGDVYVREMTSFEKDMWEDSIRKEVPNADPNKPVEYEVSMDDFRAKLAVVTVCNSKGTLLFKPEDAKVLSKKLRATDMDKILKKAQELNAITKDDKEEMVKN